MPTIDENLKGWNSSYDWHDGGEEWSQPFGGTDALWWFVLYPRISRFLPARRILEIAPGYGRWTQFLKHHCESLIGVDLSAKCVDHCRKRFEQDRHTEFHVNDGRSLAMVRDGTVDFAFSFDSLVHVEIDVLRCYVEQLARKLAPEGVAFIHHSNIGTYARRLLMWNRYQRLPQVLKKHVLTENSVEALLSLNAKGWRGTSVTALAFKELCERVNLVCTSQEVFSWLKGRCAIDAISVFTKRGSAWDRGYLLYENADFMRAAAMTANLARLYQR